ncbi:MAG TPA: type III pantothenate kinase [Thermoanaerobaculia bacterium]|nr:type III pantothenate kinase [Thermoanaerobaculia bacterium]
MTRRRPPSAPAPPPPAAAGELLVLVDVGNTNAVFGVYRGDALIESFRLSTDAERTSDEHAALLLPLFQRAGLDPASAEAVVISSVVPPLHAALGRLSRELFRREPLFIEPGVKTGLPIRYDNPAEVGADRIVNSVAARELYGAPVIVVDFGTATTFDVVNAAGEYVGGIIAPGISISAEALFARASRLRRVDVKRPAHLIGRDTSTAMQSGFYYGTIGLVDGILARLLEEMPGVRNVVATGGQAELIAEGSSYIREVNPLITLIGLKLIYERNRG